MWNWILLAVILAASVSLELLHRVRSDVFPALSHQWKFYMAQASHVKRAALTFLPLVALFVLVLLVAAFTVRSAIAPNTVTLPIEVFPLDGRSEHVESVTVNISDPSSADSLYIQIHAPGYQKNEWTVNGTYGDYSDDRYDEKASFRINGGAWIDINNQNFVPRWPESLYYSRGLGPHDSRGRMDGPIGEYLHTIRGALSISGTGDLTSGANTIEFRFNGTEGVSSGYRILAIELRNGAGTDLIDGTTFEMDDFSAWIPPEGYDNSSDISAGQTLWTSRNILHDGGAVFGPNQTEPIIASCADCHARNAYDLEFYNYSNRTIIARSRFHGLTEEEGKQIAAYVRSRQLPAHDAQGVTWNDCSGRPWNPPYQPGPGLDDKPAVCWGAGAGLEWVLDDTEEAFPYWQDERDAGRTDTESLHGINVREIPIALQLPDWNNWLPDIHPVDMLGETDFENWGAPQKHDNAFAYLEGESDPRQAVIDDFNQFYNDPVGAELDASTGARAGQPIHDLSSFANETEEYMAKLGAAQFRVVAEWAIHNSFPIQDVKLEQFGPDPERFIQDRKWLGNPINLFETAPHRSGKPGYDQIGPYATRAANQAFSTGWYELQLIINPGDRISGTGGPIDWNYQFGHIGAIVDFYGHNQWMRAVRNMNHQLQEKDGQILEDSDYFYEKLSIHTYIPSTIEKDLVNADEMTSANVLRETYTDMTRQWLSVMLRMPVADIRRKSSCDARGPAQEYHPSNCIPEPDNYTGWNQMNSYYWLAGEINELGVPATLVDSLARRGEAIWPSGNWEQWMCDGACEPASSPPSVQLTSPTDGSTFTAPATVTLSADASDADGIEKVEFYANGTLIATRTDTYSFEWTDVSGGSYSLEAKAIDNAGESQTSSPVSITVETTTSTSSTQDISLGQGWNLVSSHIVPPNAALEDVLAGVVQDISLMKDEDGNSFIPADDINTIGSWDTVEGYMIYSESSQTLVMEGDQLSASETTLSLESGWNIVSYLPTFPIPADEAFTSIADQLVMVKDVAGNAYVPDHGVNDIGDLQPGRAYKVYVSAQAELTYPSSSSKLQTASVSSDASHTR